MSRKLTWSKDHESRYNALFNKVNEHYKGITKENFISKKKQFLISFIHDLKEYAPSTKENMFFMVARWLSIHEPSQTEWIKAFQQSGYNLKLQIDEKEGENKLDEKEKENYRPREYFINILNQTNFYQIESISEHFKYLLLALLVYQPPVRTDYYITAKFVVYKKDINNIDNYIRIFKENKNTKIEMIINKDKASNYKQYASNKSLSEIEITDEELKRMIQFSVSKFPRLFLFQVKNNPISQNTLLKWLRDITKLPSINIDMMRSIYITWFYENNRAYKDREHLSKQMRHSQSTASKNYFKINEEIPKTTDEKIKLIKDLENKLNQKDYEINKLTEEQLKDIKLMKKRKADIVYLLNHKQDYKAKGSTLNKYNIQFDAENNRWF